MSLLPIRFNGRLFLPLLLLLLVLAGVAGALQYWRIQADARMQLADMSERTIRQIQQRMGRYEYGLRGLAGAVNAVGIDDVTRVRLANYFAARDLTAEFPGARGFGLIRRVANANTEQFVAAARLEGRPTFSLRELSANVDDRWIIQHIVPYSTNKAAEGLDIASESIRRDAMRRAVDTGGTVLSEPITLLQLAHRTNNSFALMFPIYVGGRVPPTLAARRELAAGLVFAPLVIEEILETAILYPQELSLRISSLPRNQLPTTIFESGQFASKHGDPAFTRELQVFGVRWRVESRPNHAFYAKLNHVSPLRVGLLVLLIGALLSGGLFLWRIAHERRDDAIKSQIHLASIVENSNDAIIGKSLTGQVYSWNAAAEKMFGYSAGEAIGQTIATLIVPSDLRPEEERILASISRGERLSQFVTRRHRQDGSELTVSVSVAPIKDADGNVIGASTTVRDVTEQVEAERTIRDLNTLLEERIALRTRQLQDARNQLQTILDALPSSVSFWDEALVNRFANRAFAEWWGIAADKIVGSSLKALLGETLHADSLPYIERVLAGESLSLEREMTAPGTQLSRQMIVQYLPHRLEGRVAGFYLITHDITDSVTAREQLSLAREQELRMERLASLGLMVAGVAHELNTPLGAAMLAIENMTDVAADFKIAWQGTLRRSDVERMISEFDAGLALLEKNMSRSAQIVRQFKQVAGDRASAERRQFNIEEVVSDVMHLVRRSVIKGTVALNVDVKAAIAMDSYPGVVGQVIQNLVDNAALHAFRDRAPGRIDVLVQQHGDASVQITVSDDGQGIPEAISERVWDPFFTTRRGEGGTGLGLHIVQRLVTEVLGGQIVLRQPTTGRGSVFEVVIPCVAPH